MIADDGCQVMTKVHMTFKAGWATKVKTMESILSVATESFQMVHYTTILWYCGYISCAKPLIDHSVISSHVMVKKGGGKMFKMA